jgi:hypothetical protein
MRTGSSLMTRHPILDGASSSRYSSRMAGRRQSELDSIRATRCAIYSLGHLSIDIERWSVC